MVALSVYLKEAVEAARRAALERIRAIAQEDAQGTTEYAILVGVLVVTNNH